MSTMLKTAAMSLLSKTLQTFLYKYLSDVDVEGVALPSVYDGSGWGVRLSNVKLREGVQLMAKLPGMQTRKRKRAKKKQSKKKTGVSEYTLAEVDADVPDPHELDDYGVPKASKASPIDTRDTSYEIFSGRQDNVEELKQDDGLQETSLHFSDTGQLRPTRSRASSTDELEVPIYDRDGEPESPPSRPSTPLQDSKSIFSCFTKGRKDEKANHKSETDYVEDKTHVAAPDEPADAGDDASSRPPISVVEEAAINRQISALAMDEKKEAGEKDDSKRLVEENIDEESEDEDEFEDYEQPFRLCLGNNGRIGSLDVRLVDRELHVMIEDAVLTVEAFPVEKAAENYEGESDEKFTNEHGTDSTGGAAGSASAGNVPSKAAPAPAKPAAPKAQTAESKRATVGDRVLADNALARAISAIPHLLLRDVRIRFIIRKEPKSSKHEEETNADNVEEAQTSIPSSNQAGPGDTMLEVGIEFLSVNSGEDILSSFEERRDEDPETPDATDGENTVRPPLATIQAPPTNVTTSVDNNEYLVRHIRTGRGPAGGIWVQVFAPEPKLSSRSEDPGKDGTWARQQWVLATNFHLLRCSGIDVRARIHLGSKKQVSTYSWFYDYEEGDEYDYDDDTLDSMLVGFDAIAPGPQRPLPPMNPEMSRGDTPSKIDSPKDQATIPVESPSLEPMPAMHPGSDKYTKDSNGIQSCRIPSTFHRISRGMLPGTCKDCKHLPSETCTLCWEGPATVPEQSTLDSSMPMPGLALHIMLRDPLEVNVDRPSVETLNLLKTLFAKQQEPKGDETMQVEKRTDGKQNSFSHSPADADNTIKTSLSTGTSFFGFLSTRTKEAEKEEDNSEAYSPNMQPENIQVLGVHLSEVVLRVHVMSGERRDDGLSFCYWDTVASCVTLDLQSCKSKDLVSSDVRFDVGYFTWNEFSGVDSKSLVALGIPLKSRESSDSAKSVPTMKSLVEDHSRNKSPWPSAACALMDIPPPPETVQYKDRQGHGLQLRFISVKNPEDLNLTNRSMVSLRLGPTTTRFPWGFWRDINAVRKQITWGILGKPEEANAVTDGTKTNSYGNDKANTTASISIMTYSVQIDSGSIIMDPMINLSMPLTRFAGERSSEAGISFESILNKLQIAYGRQASSESKTLSLKQLALLPESVRTRVLFCLDDLKPLEEALELKKEANPFKRTRAVNKGILKMANKVATTSQSASRRQQGSRRSSANTPPRRQHIMTELMKLDNDELDELWATHQRHRKKQAKKRASINTTG